MLLSLYKGKEEILSEIILDMARMLFKSSFIDDVSGFMGELFTALLSILNKDFVNVLLSIFGGVAGSLLLIYFMMGVISQATKETFTIEKFLFQFLRLMVAFTILVELPELITMLVKLGDGLYGIVASEGFRAKLGLSGDGVNYKYSLGSGAEPISKFPTADQIKKAGLWDYGIGDILDILQIFLISIITSILTFVARLVVYFVTVSNAVMIIAKAVFSPIAICQLFDENSKGKGLAYIKSFTADCAQMAIIVVLLFASAKLTEALVSNLYSGVGGLVEMSKDGKQGIVHLENFDTAIRFSNLHRFCLPQLAATGSVLGASKLSHEIF